jgi:hypothetical protein
MSDFVKPVGPIRNPMSVDKTKDTAPTKKAIAENKVVEAKPDSLSKTENKPDSLSTESKPDAPRKQGMGEGQKAVTKAYKDNWNAIFAKKKKR